MSNSFADYSICDSCGNYIYKNNFDSHYKECSKIKKKTNIHNKNKYQIQKYTPQQTLTVNSEKMILHFLKKYEEMFAGFVSNKCIALIGPAESILNTGKGHLIDKFDIVVRLNKSIPLPEGISQDIGTKTDIIYNSLNTSDFPGENKLSTKLYKKYGVKFVSSSYPYHHQIFKPDIQNYIYKYNFDIPFKTFDDGKFHALERLLGTRPYTGTCAIADLLSYPIKYLYISGLDFYYSKYYKEYRTITKGQLKHTRNSPIHQNKPQLNYLKNLSLLDNRIILDSFLDGILYEDYYKVYKNLAKIESNEIFQFSDVMLGRFFMMKQFNCTFTKRDHTNSASSTKDDNFNSYPNFVFTTNKDFKKSGNEYLIYISNNKNELNFINSQNTGEKKRFIGNFFYVNNSNDATTSPAIFLNKIFIKKIKQILTPIEISNCNIYLLLILSIILYLPENHIFSYKDIMETYGLNVNEKKLITFLYKKNKINLLI